MSLPLAATHSPPDHAEPPPPGARRAASRQAGPDARKAADALTALRAVQDMALALSSDLSFEALLRKVLRSALDVCGAGGGALLLHDPLTNRLRCEVADGLGGFPEGRSIDSAEGIAGWVFTHGEPLVVDDARSFGRLPFDFADAAGPDRASLLDVPLIVSTKKIGILELLNKCTGEPFSGADVDLLMILAAQSAVAIDHVRLSQHLWNERERILAVEEGVRRELAGDIHDGPAQVLAAMAMNVRFLRALLEDNSVELAKHELASLDDLTTRALKQVRRLLFGQRPVILETQGLFPALETLVAGLSDEKDVQATLQIKGAPVRLPGKGDLTVFSIVQEAVSNARKHAPGAHLAISVETDGDRLIVRVSDDGPGFDLSAATATYDRRGTFGLLNMRERAEQTGGTVAIESAPGMGTRVTLTVPLPAIPSGA